MSHINRAAGSHHSIIVSMPLLAPVTVDESVAAHPGCLRLRISRLVQIARWENKYLVRTKRNGCTSNEAVVFAQKIGAIRSVRDEFMNLAKILKKTGQMGD